MAPRHLRSVKAMCHTYGVGPKVSPKAGRGAQGSRTCIILPFDSRKLLCVKNFVVDRDICCGSLVLSWNPFPPQAMLVSLSLPSALDLPALSILTSVHSFYFSWWLVPTEPQDCPCLTALCCVHAEEGNRLHTGQVCPGGHPHTGGGGRGRGSLADYRWVVAAGGRAASGGWAAVDVCVHACKRSNIYDHPPQLNHPEMMVVAKAL